uniref:uncharacterized protein LOC127069205 n=1 Tax=Vespula vulgaris TaxID=7454 RepID=UPI00223B90C2|nr:uncharacterized protein LOC127069205 [Vespula vulgaris]
MVQSCYEFRRVHIVVHVVCILWRMKLWSGDSGLPEMTTKSSVRPILIVNGSVLLRISKSTYRSSRSMHSLENEMEEWGYSPTRDDNISAQLLVQSCYEFRRVHNAVLVVRILWNMKWSSGDILPLISTI